jgi:hypothetical protein
MSVSHQTARLAAGAHGSAEEGLCVMELASLLTGELFTDKPASVSPVIAGFLRGYNDRLDDRRRQELIPFAARVIGTRAGLPIEAERAARCVAFATTLRRCRHRGTRWFLARRLWNPAIAVRTEPEELIHGAGYMTACMLRRIDADTHARALALVEEMIALGGTAGAQAGPFWRAGSEAGRGCGAGGSSRSAYSTTVPAM